MDGWDVLGRMKADPELVRTPVVIVSMVDERGKGFALGAADYLVKPVNREALLRALHRAMSARPTNGSATTILAVDDDPMAIDLVRAILEPEGYRVVAALGGDEGVELAQRERPGLIVLDLMMPKVDGFAVVERLRADPDTANIPIVVLTAKSMTPTEKDRLNGYVVELAKKGEFDRASFVAMVRGLCQPLPA
jgi:CheY-like chemotaxis protein